ncbi:hypothetical protein D3C84_876470 [compost metagenome]
MVDHQVHRRQWIDPLRVAAGLGHGGAHGRQVNHCWNPGEILHQHPCWAVLDFAVGAALLEPVGQGAEVIAGDGLVVFPAQQIFQQDLQRHRQTLQVAEALGGFGQAEVVIGTVGDRQGLEGFQAIERGHYQLLLRRCPAIFLAVADSPPL